MAPSSTMTLTSRRRMSAAHWEEKRWDPSDDVDYESDEEIVPIAVRAQASRTTREFFDAAIGSRFSCCTANHTKQRPQTSRVTRVPSKTYDQVTRPSKRGTPPDTPLKAWLAARNLEIYAEPLAKIGCKRVSDLVFLTDDDMQLLNVEPHARVHFHIQVA